MIHDIDLEWVDFSKGILKKNLEYYQFQENGTITDELKSQNQFKPKYRTYIVKIRGG